MNLIEPRAEDPDALPMLCVMRDRVDDMAHAVALFDDSGFHTRSKTRRGTPYVTLANGYAKPEGAPMPAPSSLYDMINWTVEQAQVLRDRVTGPALLTWRDLVYDSRGLWVRLAFEPLFEAEA
jgi:hypothetical protein